MRPYKAIAPLSLLLLCSVTAEARDWYVHPEATGTRSGSDWTNAFTTLPSVLIRGDTYYLAAGTYPSYIFDDPLQESLTITIRKATIANHGTNLGWDSRFASSPARIGAVTFQTGHYIIDGAEGGGREAWTNGHGIVIHGSSSTIDERLITFLSGGSHVTLMHVDVGNPIQQDIGFDICIYSAQGAGNNTFQKCYFRNTGGRGFTILNSTGWQFSENRIDRVTRTGVSPDGRINHGVGFELVGQTNNFTLRNNYITNLEGTGWIGIYGNGADGLVIYGNVFACSSDYNGTWGNGVVFNVSGVTGPLKNVRVYNNTFANLTSSRVLFLSKDINGSSPHPLSSGNEFVNNLVWKNRSGVAVYDGASYRAGNSSDLRITGDQSFELLSSEPFLDLNAGSFRLRSPTAKGIRLPEPYHIDLYGLYRQVDGTWDRGAYEYDSGERLAPSNGVIRLR